MRAHGLCFLVCVTALAIVLPANAVEIEGTVQSVNTAARKLSITRKTAGGEKTLSLDVSAKAGDLSSLKAGDTVKLDYDPEEEVVTHLSIDTVTAAAAKPDKNGKTEGSRRGAAHGDNVALASRGTRLGEIWANGAALLDGEYEGEPAHDGIGKQWIVTFPKVYELSRIKMKLWDEPNRFYTYTIEASEDGTTFKPLVDRSKGQWKGWQVLDFQPQPIKAIRLTGLSDTLNTGFHVHELEAYSTP